MLRRVQRLEQSRLGPPSPFTVHYGSFEAFEAEVQAKVDAGQLDRIDMAGVVNALRRWQDSPEMWRPKLT